MNELKEGDIIIALKDEILAFDDPSTPPWIIYKNIRHKLINILPLFPKKSWAIIRCDNDDSRRPRHKHYALSEEYILNNFNCIRIHRKEKLEILKNDKS